MKEREKGTAAISGGKSQSSLPIAGLTLARRIYTSLSMRS